MAFVRKKKGRGGDCFYQLVESRRVDGKPRQKVLLHLGRHQTVADALRKWPGEIRGLRRAGKGEEADQLKEKLGRLRDFKENGTLPA